MSEIEKKTETGEETESRDTVSDWPSPGEKMKKLREELGLSHARVAEALHMTAHYVKALENDQFEKLPGKTFVKGYFKSYARLLGADVDEVLDCYLKYVAALEESEESEAEDIRARKAYDQNIRWMICAAVIIVLVIGISWWLSRDDQSGASTVAGTASRGIAEVPETESSPLTAEMLVANLEGKISRDRTDVRIESEDLPVQVKKPGLAGTPSLQTGHGEPALQETALAESGETPSAVVSHEMGSIPSREQPKFAGGTPVDSELITPGSDLPEYTVTRFDDRRMVSLEGTGDDLLKMHFNGASWVEVNDGENTRLYHDLLNGGDDLTIRWKAPFNILVGDANVVEITFNSNEVEVLSRIRADNSARILLETGAR